MLIEISFIQRFGLFLGQPVLSLSVLLFSLLAGAGLGGLWSGRLSSNKIKKGIGMMSLIVGAIIIAYTFLLPIILNQLLGFNLAIRIGTTILFLIPLGFFMGFPFPLGIRLLKEMEKENDIPWMWGVNGVSSVFGSALTIVLAIRFGFTGALLASAGCYFLVFLTFFKGVRK